MEVLRRSSVLAAEIMDAFDRSPTDKELVAQAKALGREFVHARLLRAGLAWSAPERAAAPGGRLAEVCAVLLRLGKYPHQPSLPRATPRLLAGPGALASTRGKLKLAGFKWLSLRMTLGLHEAQRSLVGPRVPCLFWKIGLFNCCLAEIPCCSFPLHLESSPPLCGAMGHLSLHLPQDLSSQERDDRPLATPQGHLALCVPGKGGALSGGGNQSPCPSGLFLGSAFFCGPCIFVLC